MLTSLDTTDRILTVDEIRKKYEQRARDLELSSDADAQAAAKSARAVAGFAADAIRRHEGDRCRTPNASERL